MSLLDQQKFKELVDKVHNEVNPSLKRGEIQNRSNGFDDEIMSSHPQMLRSVGDTQTIHGKMLHEAHIFLGPINPAEDEIQKYKKIVRLFNETFDGNFLAGERSMQDPILRLNFEKEGYVTVMQSSLYIKSDDMKEVIETTHQLAELFAEGGFVVIREKIEATASKGCKGLPYDNATAEALRKYFEFHIRTELIGKNIDDEPTEDELASLVDISDKYRTKFGTPVPFSYNKSKIGVGKSFQRYLNVRFQCGFDEAYEKVKLICEEINSTGTFKVVKVISEYVWYDTFRVLDKGWIDFDDKLENDSEGSSTESDLNADEIGLGSSDGFPRKVMTFLGVIGAVSILIGIAGAILA